MVQLTQHRRALAAILVAALASQTPLVAHADKTPTAAQMTEARQRYERGMKLYNEGAFDAALVEMQRAYELAPSYKILYNLGLIQRQLNDYASALKSFRRYLDEGGNKVPKDKRAEVTSVIPELEKRVATVTVEVDVTGAEVSVDDAPVGNSPLDGPVLVNAGKRKISAKLPGKPAATRVITVAGTDTVNVKLELDTSKGSAPTMATTAPTTTPTTTPTTAPSTTTKVPEGPPPKREVPWVAWGVTGGLAVAAGVTGIIAFGASKSLADKRDSPTATRDELDSARSKTKTWALVTDVLLVGTVAAAGVSLYLTLKQPSTKDTAQAGVKSAKLGIAPTGLVLSGSF